jgi:hypothetical protein
MNEQVLYQYLDDLLKLLKQLCQPMDNFENRLLIPSGEIQVFMQKILELYLLIQRGAADRYNLNVQDYLNQSASMMSDRLQGFAFRNYHLPIFEASLSNMLSCTFYDDEWSTKVCPMRSQLEAFNELYRETSYKEFVDDDFEPIDVEIRRVGEIEGGHSLNRIPEHMPSSHWWWWYPDEPPETRIS